MVSYSDVKRVAVTKDVALVESVCCRKLPLPQGVDALQHGIEGVTLGIDGVEVGSPTFAVGATLEKYLLLELVEIEKVKEHLTTLLIFLDRSDQLLNQYLIMVLQLNITITLLPISLTIALYITQVQVKE